MFKKALLYIAISICSLNSIAQVSEATSKPQTFSISKDKGADETQEGNSGKLKFNITTVKVGDDSTDLRYHYDFVDKSPPIIKITSPEVKRGFKLVELEKVVIISGEIEDESGIFEVLINGQEAQVTADGQFWMSLPLAFGDNDIVIAATDIKQNTAIEKLVIERKAAEATAPFSANFENRISWQSPISSGITTDQESFIVQTCIESKAEVSEVNIYLNDWKIYSKTADDLESIGACKYTLSQAIKLHLDLNRIKIEVITAQGTFNAIREITYNPASGKYYALIIGVEDYADPAIKDLDEPINDAQKLHDVLTTKYNFDTENIIFLKNPTKSDIIAVLHSMRSSLTENDNLLIFYAGHGYFDEEMNTGYWLPSDARQDNPVNWLENQVLINHLSVIKTKHILLIADACFSGGIFKTRSAFQNNQAIESMYELPSRKAMTSGTLNTVPDKSVFMKYLLKRLDENKENFLPAGELFSSLRIAVINNAGNTPSVPQYGTMQNVGDEGGDFIFMKR